MVPSVSVGLSLGVLLSGTGTNFGAIAEAVDDGRIDARIALVISNRVGAGGLERATAHRIPTETIPHRDFPTREAFDARLVERLRAAGCEWVVLAGFMRVVTPVLLDAFPDRVINIHPAILPAFPGVDAQSQALAHGVKVTGCTVHLVDAGVDTGPILAQAVVPVAPEDTRDSLGARLLVAEHALLVHTLAAVARGELVVTRHADGRRHARLTGSTQALFFGGAPAGA